MTVVRMFGHGVATGFHLQDPAAPGTYSERAFQAFDYVLDQAARFGLKLVISLANNWDTDSNSDNKCAAPRRFRHRSQLAVSAWGVVNTPPVECPGRRPPRARGLPAGRGVAREADAAPRRQVCVHGRRGEPGRVLHLGVRAQGVHGARAHGAVARQHHQQQGAPAVLRAACFRGDAAGEPVPAHKACSYVRRPCRLCAQRGGTARASYPPPRTSAREVRCTANAGRACAPQTYSNDDAILSWDLINEPRCERIGCDTEMLAWIEEMAPYVKALDGNHLLTVGARTAMSHGVWVYGRAGSEPLTVMHASSGGAPTRAGRRAGVARRRCLLRCHRLALGGPAVTPLGRGCRHAWQTADEQDESLPRLTRRAPQAWTAFTTGATASRPLATPAAGRATPGRTSCRSTPCARSTTRACTCGPTTGSARTWTLAAGGRATTAATRRCWPSRSCWRSLARRAAPRPRPHARGRRA